jgi:CDP-diacylglycerol---glycerol-3-phosphate 3-phosphatidyltransferase
VISSYLFSDAVNGIYWATGYMNFTKSMISLINNHNDKNIKLLTASPSANGFYKAGRAKSYIPYLYRVYETYIHKPVWEYNRPGWTFHVKGLWAEFSDNQTYLTAIGSSNYSNRSAYRDSEI